MEATQTVQPGVTNSLPRVTPPDPLQRSDSTGLDGLGQGDFLRLLITQLEQQDPFDPVDNKDMLAQMAQFSSLAGTTESNATLTQIVSRLDTLIETQNATLEAVIEENAVAEAADGSGDGDTSQTTGDTQAASSVINQE